MNGLLHITENMLKGRWDDSRIPNESELKATKVIEMTIELASCKIVNFFFIIFHFYFLIFFFYFPNFFFFFIS